MTTNENTPEKSTTGDKCPWCGADEITYTTLLRKFDCGTLVGKMAGTTFRTSLCHALERANKAEAIAE
jgi:transcription elongation factor Elf1